MCRNDEMSDRIGVDLRCAFVGNKSDTRCEGAGTGGDLRCKGSVIGAGVNI